MLYTGEHLAVVPDSVIIRQRSFLTPLTESCHVTQTDPNPTERT